MDASLEFLSIYSQYRAGLIHLPRQNNKNLKTYKNGFLNEIVRKEFY